MTARAAGREVEMKTHFINVNKRLIVIVLLTITFCVSLFFGLFGGFSRIADGADEEITFTSIQVALTVDVVYDDYDTKTIKKDLKVTGITADDRKIPITSGYTVEFANGKLVADAPDNVITVRYGTLSADLPVETVVVAEATPQISAIEEYEQSGAYFINSDGFYAFVQGMTAEQVQSRLAVALVYPNHTEYVPFDGNKVKWASSAPDFGSESNTSDLTVPVSLSLTGIDGVEDTVLSGDAVFAVAKRAALKLRDGWTQPDGLIPATTVSSFATTLQGYVYVVMNSGFDGGTISVESELSYSGLYVGATVDAIKNCAENQEFNKTLEIPYNGTGVKPLRLNLKVKYKGYVGIEKRIQGDLPSQIARAEKLNLGDTYVETIFEDADGIQVYTRLYLKDVPENEIKAKFYNGSVEQEGLTRSVTRISLSYTAPGSSTTATANFQGVQVSPIGIARPAIADKELTYSTEGCSTTISGLLTGDPYGDDMKVETSSPYAVYNNGTITFSRGGSYTITVSFVKGSASDFTFLTGAGDGTVNPDDPTKVTYTVNVLKAPIVVTLENFPGEIQYGNAEPSYTVRGAVEGNETMQFTATNKINSDNLAYEDKTSEAPSYRLYYTGTLEKGGSYASYAFPTERGSYTVQLNTAETAWYDAGELSTPFEFTIIQRRIVLSAATVSPVTFELGTEYSEADVIKQVTASGFAPQHQSDPGKVVSIEFSGANRGKTVTHAGDYGVTVSIINDNYKWSDTEDANKNTTFTINKAALYFSASQNGFTYGDIKPAAAVNESGLRGWATLGAPSYTKDGAAFTEPANGVWPAGSYKAVYSIGSYTDGVLASDVTCNPVETTFTVARKEITKVVFDTSNSGQTYKNAAYVFALNNYLQGEQTLANGASFYYKDILNVTTSGVLLTDNTTKITTIAFNADTGEVSVTDAGNYTFAVSIKDPNFTWTSEGDDPQTITATAVIEQRVLDFKLNPDTDLSFTGENQVPETLVDWKLGETFTADLTCAYYTDAGDSISKNDIISAGGYKVVVTAFGITQKPAGAAYTYAVNYKLPDDANLHFNIKTPFLQKPSLKGGVAEVTYQGKNNAFDFLDYIEGDTYIYIANGETLCNLKFAYSIDGNSYNKLAIAGTYTVTVTPAENFKWDNGAGGDGGEAPVMLTFTVKRLPVLLVWTESSLSSTYGENPAPSVAISNAVIGDTVSIVIGYKDKDGSAVIAGLTNGSAAGYYTVYAADFDGDDKDNYVLDGSVANAALSQRYTVLKKELNMPVQPAAATESVFGGSVWSGSISGFANYNLTSALVAAQISGVRPSEWYTQTVSESDRKFDTSGEQYSFNVSNGNFTCFNAGYYSVEFKINDSANYCWKDSGKTLDFDYTGNYTHVWNEFAKIERKTITAPVLGSNRAMEWESVTALDTILTGALANVNYGVLYGTNKESGNITGTTQGSVDGFDGKKAKRGQYYALLTLTGDPLNYVWTVKYDNADETGYAGASFVNGGTVYEIFYTNENGAQVKLYYAITASQVNVQLTVSNYEYGENGAFIGNTANTDKKGLGNVIVLAIPEGYDDATYDGTAGGGGGVEYTFYKSGAKIDETELVNGLPWDAGGYEVRIVITFDKNSAGEEVYSQWDSGLQKLTVTARTLTVIWSYGGNTGNSLSTDYNGAGQMPTAQITNMPAKNDVGDVDLPGLEYNYTADNKPENAGNYTVSVTNAGANFSLTGTASCAFTINRYSVSIEAVGVTNHVYGEEINVDGKWQYVGSNNFFNSDAGSVKLVILLNGSGEAQTSAKTPVGTYKLCPVWNNYSTLTLDGSGAYILETTNYTISVQSADFTVVKRQLTVTFTSGGASSVYGEGVNLYQEGVIYTLSTNNGTGAALADNVADVFKLTASLNSVAATGDSKNWGIGIYTVSGEAKNSNYDIAGFDSTGVYEITAAEITNIQVSGYVGEYDAISHDMFTVDATTVNNQTVVWYYKNTASTEDKWLPYVSDGKNAQIINVADSAVYYVKATAANHVAAVYKVGGIDAEIAVTVNKAVLKVQINLDIWYGEANPATLPGGAFKATVGELVSNPEMYVINDFAGSEQIGDVNASGTFEYSTDYTQGDNADSYKITFIKGSLTAPNYNFENAVNNGKSTGVLTVKPLALEVEISDIENVYYDTYSQVKFQTGVNLPVSTYTDVTITQSELDAEVWNNIFGGGAAYTGANIVKLVTTAFEGTNPNTRTKKAGEYAISGSLITTPNYTATFKGSNGTTAKHVINPAELAVNDITGYINGYDEQEHLALTVKADGEITAVFATANDGTKPAVHFYAAEFVQDAVSAEELDWDGLTLVTDPIKYIDACHKNVYYRITAGDNYRTYYGMCEVEITPVANEFKNESQLKFNGWTYGLYSATNLNGYNAETTHKITEPEAKFTRTTDGVNTFKFVLTRDGNAIEELAGDFETVSELFAAMWKDGLFGAGDYALKITMDATANYDKLEKTFSFKVSKKTLTVTAEDKEIVYGNAAPEYTYTVSGFVAGKSDGVVETEADILGANNRFFTSDYVIGRLGGSVGAYEIKHFQQDGSTVIGGLTDIVLKNYSFIFVKGELSVTPRTITVTINDAENFYNLSVVNGTSYGKEDVAEWETGYSVSGVYSGDTENGVQHIFALRTDALNSDSGRNTNNAGTYPVYAEWLAFERNGSQISYGLNYTVIFEDCSYRGELPENAITSQDGSYCAGTYTIKQAVLIVDIRGPFNNAEGTQPATHESVFSNSPKYYKAFVTNDADEVDFEVTYYKDSVSDKNKLDGAPKDVGSYYVTATTENRNYTASVVMQAFKISPATLNVGWVVNGTTAAEIQYGENIPALDRTTNSYPANNRFSGLTYRFSSAQFAELTEQELIALLGNVVYGYTTDYTNQTTADVNITPDVTVSPNFIVVSTKETLKFVPRKITVQVNGYDEGNSTATSKYTGKAPFADNEGWAIADWLKAVESDAFVHGHGLIDLGISLTIESQNYNASTTPYKVNVLKENNPLRPVSNNYSVSFVVGDEQLPYSNSVKPTYLITKKDIVFTAKDVTVIYGGAIDANVANGILQSNLSSEIFNRYFTVEGFENGETYMSISDSAMQNNSFVFGTNYKPYSSHVGDIITLSISNSTVEFTNYEVKNFINGKVIVSPRVITAQTSDLTYLEETDKDGNKVYNNGVYGASRNAVIEFVGHDDGVGYTASYAPGFTVSYNTVAGAGQTANAAPTKVGNYTVTVRLTSRDYVFAANSTSSSLPFNVNKQTVSPSWLYPAIANNPQPGQTVDLTNSVAGYVASVMTLSNFQKTVGDNVYAITEGNGPDQYRIGTVGSERVGLTITAQGTGEYRVTLSFTEAATANYRWNDSDSATEVTIIFNVTTNKVYITDLSIKGWTYKQYSAETNAVGFNVSNGNKDGVQITYALITGQIPTDTAGFQKLSYTASIPEAAGNYAVRAYYPSYQGVGGDEQFISFTILKATVATPVITVEGNNGVFGGAQLNSAVEFDPTVLRISGYNGTNYASTGNGAMLYAVDAGTYTVTFAIIDGANYQWGTNAPTVEWVVDKADNNVVTWNNTEEQRTVEYGNVFVPDATATYGGRVYYSYMLKTGGKEPSADDSGWVSNFNKFNVGEYYIKASNSGNNNYNGDVKIISFKVTKATLTVTPHGSMIYGSNFVDNDPAFDYTVTAGLVRGDDPNEVIRTVTGVTYGVVGSPAVFQAKTYAFVLVTDKDGNVTGLEADNYKIVSGTGEFVVNRRSIVVNIGNKTSQYGCPVDLSDVSVTYGSLNGLVEGDSLNLTFTTTATQSSVKGGYIINATYNNSNYNATINPGTYTITERLITVEMVQGGGVYGENIAGVTYSKVLDEQQADITDFVTGKLNITVVYSGTANDGTVFNGVEMPTLAGTYVATVKGSGNNNFIVVGEPFTQFVISKKEVDGSFITVANQTYDGNVKTPVINNSAFVTAYGDGIYEELAHVDFINAGTHYITLRLNDSDNYKWLSVEVAERELTFTIDKADNLLTGDINITGWVYGEYNSKTNSPSASVKFGQELIVFTYCDTVDGVYYSGAPATGDVGEYYVRATVMATDNYNAFESAPVRFTITQKALSVPSLAEIKEGEGKNDVYTGGELLSAVLGFDMALMNLDYNGKSNVSGGKVTLIAVDAGTYTVKISIANTHNYRWSGNDENEIVLSWIVAPKAVAKPTANTDRFIVNGRTLTYFPEGFNEEIMTIEGNQTAYGGEFTVTVGLKDKANYVWADGGVEDITFEWTVTGINTVFKIVVSSLLGVCGVAVLAAGVQLLLDRRRKRLIDRDIDKRSLEENNAKKANAVEERGNE